MPLLPEAPKIQVHWFNDKSRTREFTKQAWDFIQGSNLKWVISDDQSQPEEAKKKVVAPVEIKDKKPELRERYKELSGKEADQVWNEARLFVEIGKAEKVAQAQPPAQVETKTFTKAETEQVLPNPPAPTPKKRGRKAKVTA